MANTYDTYKAVQNAIQVGQAWGEQEVAAWFDSHDGSMDSAPAWTRGTYCGELPDDETREFIEAIIDLSAQHIWDVVRTRSASISRCRKVIVDLAESMREV